jgi:hypothetical protein
MLIARRMVRVLVLVCVCGVSLSLVSEPWAWEFTLNSGNHAAQWIGVRQTGTNGFFGPYDVDNQAGLPDAASSNFWWGYGIASGSSGGFGYHLLTLYPRIKVNEAISFQGDLWVGPYITNDPVRHIIETSYIPFSNTFFTTGWVTVRTPWGHVSYGKMPFEKGCGLQFAATARWADTLWFGRTEDMLEIVAPYGPFKFSIGVNPWSSLDLNDPYGWVVTGGGLATGYGFPIPDTTFQTKPSGYASIDYASGPMEMGIGIVFKGYDWGPELAQGTANRVQTPSVDGLVHEGWIYAKYNNGRFFFNAEADWFYRTIRGGPSLDRSIPQAFAFDVEAWRYMVELGVFAGPLKTSLFYSHIPGPDLNNPTKQSFVTGAKQSAAAVFRPYSNLLSLVYHGGTISWLDISDAYCLAGRLDYSLAANLTFSGSLLKAFRQSQTGSFLGFWAPDPGGGKYAIPAAAAAFGGTPIHYVPDNDLGWELNVDTRWELLENWMVKVLWGRFWPGRWWNYACVDKSVPNWDLMTPAVNWGVNPNRTIDPVDILRLELWTYF